MLLLLIAAFTASVASLTEEEELRLEEEIKNAIWTPLVENTLDELTRLDKSTKQFNAHATCGFSVHTDLSDYETAKQKCENSTWIGFPTPGGRKLASIHSELENKIATLMLQYAYGGSEELEGKRYEGASNWAWIGLEKVNRTGARPDGAGKLVWGEEDWIWTDGTTLDQNSYENWMTRKKSDEQIQPDMWRVGDDHQTAARIFRKIKEGESSGIWDDTFKSKPHPFICKFNIPVHYIVFPELKKWHDAKADCERRGFYFAKIRNKAENDLLVEAIQRVYNGDRHDKKFHHENWIWVGATDLKNSGEFEFYDGEPIKFSIPWARKQHDNKKTKKQGTQDYAAVSRWGEWDDSYGNDWNRPYACQCNPHGVAINKEMEEANAAWEKEVERRNAVKNKQKEEKAAKKKARKEARQAKKEARKERRKKKKEMKQKKKEDRRTQKQEKAKEKASKKAERKAAKKAKKAERRKNKDAKKAEKKEAKADRKEAKKDSKAERKSAKKAAKLDKIAAKKVAKSDRKAAKKGSKKGDRKGRKSAKKDRREADSSEFSKKPVPVDLPPYIPGQLEKRDAEQPWTPGEKRQ